MSAQRVYPNLTPSLSPEDDRDRALRTSAHIERFFGTRLRLGQLRVLVAVADLGQLKRVADSLSVTPSAVSKQLGELEAALGQPVLVRLGNHLEFTPVGTLLLRRAREILAQLERARTELDEFCAGLAGVISVGAAPNIAPLFFPAIFSALKARAPSAAVRLHEGRSAGLAPMLADGSIDLALARGATDFDSEVFALREIMSDPLALVCGIQHPLAGVDDLSWKDLSGVPWVLPIRGSTTFKHLEAILQRHGLQIPKGSVECGSWSATASLLQVYPFVAVFSLAYARRFLGSESFAVLPVSTDGVYQSVNAVWRKNEDDPLVHMLVEAVRGAARIL